METFTRGRSLAICLLLFVLAPAFQPGCGGGGDGEGISSEPAEVTVLFSSDLLGKIRSCGCTINDSGGLGRRATYTESLRGGSRELIVVDAGDAFSLDLSFTKKEAELTMESFSVMGVDVFTPGETDFIFGLPFLTSLAGNSSFEMIAANVVDPETGDPALGKDFTVITLRGGLRIGITGVLDETIRFPTYIDRSQFRVEPAEKTLRALLPRMRKSADFLILLSHMGKERTIDMLGRIKGFDVAVVGHDKPLMKKVEKVGETLVAATGGLGQYLGRLDIDLTSSGRMKHGRMRLVPLPDDIAIHPDIRELFRVYRLPLTDKEAEKH
jgi:2',3'-cyclic-nucleotide 2'-phosphodiesterase (5'-nucleotidase family)